MTKTCYGCGRTVDDAPRTFGLRVAASIKPRVGRTRYYCERCWMERLEESSYGTENKRQQKATN